jgi:hypothetical protein
MECGVPGSSVQYSFRGADIFWRAIADKDCGKADIYIDGRPEGTVDCYFQEAVPYQFAFIKTGLNPEATHTVRAVIRSDKNPLSSGTVIRHMAFESSAESYWASAGFCSIDGKNNWSYRRWNGREYADLPFLDFAVASVKDEKSGDIKERRSYAGFWGTEETCIVGSDFQVPTKQSAVRAWVAPHDGKVRSQGTVRIDADSGGTVIVRIMKNAREIWPSRRVTYWRPASHDFAATVKGGDVISFVAGKGKKGKREKVFWDPVITYEAK